MKFYGSRFCQRCGKLFHLEAPDDRLCASCEQSPVEPAAALMAAKPRHDTRKRGSWPKSATAGKNSGPVAGQRTLPMLRALAEHPSGLTTPQLAELASSASSWINALGSTRQLMLKQQRRGRVMQAGTAAGNRTRESALWRITEAGKRYVREAAHGERTSPAETIPANGEPDFGEPVRRLLPRTVAGRRACGLLSSHGYWTLGDLLYVTSMDLLAIRNFGPACLDAVREALASRGLVLVDELDPEDLDGEGIEETEAAVEALPVPGLRAVEEGAG